MGAPVSSAPICVQDCSVREWNFTQSPGGSIQERMTVSENLSELNVVMGPRLNSL